MDQFAINATLADKLLFDPVKDFAPLTLAATVPNILIVHPSIPANSVAELIAYARANPGKLRALGVARMPSQPRSPPDGLRMWHP